MAADDLDEEERELLKKHRAAKQRETREVEIGDDKGNYFRGPYHEVSSWVRRTFGIDLEAEPGEDETAEDDQKQKGPRRKGGSGGGDGGAGLWGPRRAS